MNPARLLLCAMSVVVGDTPPPDNNQRSLPDGFYLVVQAAPTKNKLKPGKDERIVLRKNLSPKGKKVGPPDYLLIKRKPAVLLDLAQPPKIRKEESGSLAVCLELKKPAGEKLRQFTKKHKGARVAVIISNNVVTTHHVREAIVGGKLKITCCVGGAIKRLIERLKKRKSP